MIRASDQLRSRMAERPIASAISVGLVLGTWTFIVAYWIANEAAGAAAGLGVVFWLGSMTMMRRSLRG
jgi:hypothetical protein